VLLVAGILAKIAPPHAVFFRWAETGFVMLLDDEASAETFHRAIRRINASREGHLLSSGSRSMMVAVSLSSVAHHLRQWSDPDLLVDAIDEFVADRESSRPRATA
jgi:GGDEF domain-containing protein